MFDNLTLSITISIVLVIMLLLIIVLSWKKKVDLDRRYALIKSGIIEKGRSQQGHFGFIEWKAQDIIDGYGIPARGIPIGFSYEATVNLEANEWRWKTFDKRVREQGGMDVLVARMLIGLGEYPPEITLLVFKDLDYRSGVPLLSFSWRMLRILMRTDPPRFPGKENYIKIRSGKGSRLLAIGILLSYDIKEARNLYHSLMKPEKGAFTPPFIPDGSMKARLHKELKKYDEEIAKKIR